MKLIREYDGKKVESDHVKCTNFNKYKVSSDLAEQIKSTAEKRELTDNECKLIEERLKKIINQPFVSGSKIGCLILVVIFSAALTVLFICGLKPAAIVVASVAMALLTFSFIQNKFFNKTLSNMISALKNNNFAAYKFNAPKKLWCSDHISSGAEEQDYAASDDEGNLYDFYIDCGGIVFSVEEHEYKEITDELIIVLFFLGKKTTLEYFAPQAAGVYAAKTTNMCCDM